MRRSITSGNALAGRSPAAEGHRGAQPHRQHRRVKLPFAPALFPLPSPRPSDRVRVRDTLSRGIMSALLVMTPLPCPAAAGRRSMPKPRRGRLARNCARSGSIRSSSASASGSIALRNSLNPAGEPAPEHYRLKTTLATYLSNLGIQSQGLATLGQLDVYATYYLIDSDRQHSAGQHRARRELVRSEPEPIFDHCRRG